MTNLVLKNHSKIIAQENSRQIGYLNYRYPNDKSGTRNLEIESLYVLPSCRRKGVASSMIALLTKKAKNMKIVWISLWTSKDMEKDKSQQFYKKLGFKKLAEQKDYYKKGISTTLFVKRVTRSKKHVK